MKALLPILILAFSSGMLSAQHHHKCPKRNPEKLAEVAAMKKIFADAKDIMVLEGLPHPYKEEELLKEESKRKDTSKILEWPSWEERFYTPAVKATNSEDILKILSGPDCLGVYIPDKCGFHSDYCLKWSKGNTTYHALLCMGCHEIMVFDGKESQSFSFSPEPLKPLLAIYDKKRPKLVKKEKAE